MPSRNSSRAASGRSRTGWSGSRRLLDAGTLRDDSRLLRPAVDGTHEDGERNGLRNDCGCGRPPRRSGLHRGPAVRPPESVVAMAVALTPSRRAASPATTASRSESHRQGGLDTVRQWAWEGPWAAATHGGRSRRGWRKRHRGVDQAGVTRVHTVTEETGDDATLALDRLTAVKGPLVRVTADAASDTVAIDETARARGATVVVPPARTATVSGPGPRSPARDRTIPWVKTRSAGAAGSRYQGPIVRAGWRTRASATRPSSARAFAPGVQPGRGVRSSSAVRS